MTQTASDRTRRIVTVVGARPQFIKAAALRAAFEAAQDFHEILVHTGQHYDTNMSDIFFQELGLRPPEYRMTIEGRNHGAMTGQMLAEIETILMTERPDALLVYGDTNSTLAGALAATKLHIPAIHVEAGLRSARTGYTATRLAKAAFNRAEIACSLAKASAGIMAPIYTGCG